MNVLDAAHLTMLQHAGGSKTLAVRLGMHDAILRSKCNPNSSTHRLAIEEASEIMGITGDYRMLHALAGEHGFVCKKADGDLENPGSVMQMILSTRVSDGALSNVLQAALADGVITPNEMTAISSAIQTLTSALLKLDVACEQQTRRAPEVSA